MHAGGWTAHLPGSCPGFRRVRTSPCVAWQPPVHDTAGGAVGPAVVDPRAASPAATPQGRVEPEPTPDRYPEYNTPSDLAAADAAAFTDEMVEELEIQETDYTRAVEQFYNEWSSRYNLALDAHKRFQWRVDRADASAADYFERQAHLTGLMTNPERRELFQRRDRQEQDLYRQWKLQANSILDQSGAIMSELRH